MSKEISWHLEVAILPGQLEKFRAVANDLIASAKKEKTTLNYEWHLSPDETSCDIYERYKDSAAVMAHVQSFGAFAERFVKSCRPTSFHIYGEPTDEVKKAIADLGPVYFSHLGGFSR